MSTKRASPMRSTSGSRSDSARNGKATARTSAATAPSCSCKGWLMALTPPTHDPTRQTTRERITSQRQTLCLGAGTGCCRRGSQELANLVVGGLAEVPVRLPDGEERGGGRRAHDFVHLGFELPARGLRRGRHGHDDPSWNAPAKRLDGG